MFIFSSSSTVTTGYSIRSDYSQKFRLIVFVCVKLWLLIHSTYYSIAILSADSLIVTINYQVHKTITTFKFFQHSKRYRHLYLFTSRYASRVITINPFPHQTLNVIPFYLPTYTPAGIIIIYVQFNGYCNNFQHNDFIS